MVRWPKVFIAATLVSMLAVPLAASGYKGRDHSVRAVFTGTATWLFPGVTPSNCTVATTVTDAIGHLSDIGLVYTHWTHCPADPQNIMDGRMTITTLLGDKLFGEYDYDPAGTSHEIPLTITGGTGRFRGATGILVGTFTVTQQFMRTPECAVLPANPLPCMDFTVPWPWVSFSVGTIRY
jgi:hypothetical protein